MRKKMNWEPPSNYAPNAIFRMGYFCVGLQSDNSVTLLMLSNEMQ